MPNNNKTYSEIKKELEEKSNKGKNEFERKEIERQKQILYSTSDGLPGNLLERNIGLAEALPNIFLFYTAPTSIVVAFSAFLATKSVIITILLEIALYTFCVALFVGVNTAMGNKFSKIGGNELVVKPSKKTIVSFTKLFIFLIIACIIFAIIKEVEIDIDTLKPIMYAFLAVYFIDLIAIKIIGYYKDEIFYDPVVDKNRRKKLNIASVIESIVSILTYGLVLFPLSLKGERFGIIIYIIIIVLLAVFFTIVDNIRLKKKKEDIDQETSKDDEADIYYDEVDKYKVFAYIAFLFLHIIILFLCWVMAWID